ncbi:MAG: MBL fold metallo-hydrolase [Verrucomicrobiota bacterium]|nr:MBL fold metallo-hydrolase [Limisphaera sp.]MDW8382967.1 MBL fold metallo-hydrolase [Verrucomicrobiota bacterium]
MNVRRRTVRALAMGLLGAASGIALADKVVLTGDRIPTDAGSWIVRPIHHASLALGWEDRVLYVDPVGPAQRFEKLPRPDLVLLTDIHADHFSHETLRAVCKPDTQLIAPPAVADRLPEELRARSTVLTNGQSTTLFGFRVTAVPMYNLVSERQHFHPRGRGNGYVIHVDSSRLYISGDTEDIPEMRQLQDIHVAFICMNLPYTMSVEQAADAVRTFRPRIVYPYHYRGSDVERFRQLVGEESGIEVRLRDWYAP